MANKYINKTSIEPNLLLFENRFPFMVKLLQMTEVKSSKKKRKKWIVTLSLYSWKQSSQEGPLECKTHKETNSYLSEKCYIENREKNHSNNVLIEPQPAYIPKVLCVSGL